MMGLCPLLADAVATGYPSMPRGGKRIGAGRKAWGNAPKTRISISVSIDIVQWLNGRTQNRSQFIETLIQREKDNEHQSH